jgi:pyruvate,water dikinase
MREFIRWLDDVGLEDVPAVGGKNASLGEMIRSLAQQGIRVPGGFVITSAAYSEMLESGGIAESLRNLLAGLNKENIEELSSCGRAARALIKKAGIPAHLEDAIRSAYRKMEQKYGTQVDVAVRSSATAEDLPEASFAGQQESFLNIRGEEALLEACLNCFASLFTDRAIAYRIDQGFDHMSVRLSIGVQKMVRSDLASAGVIFTLDPESGFRDVILITSSYGLGENVVAGRVDPDEFLVFKPTLLTGHRPIIRRKTGAKQFRMVYEAHGTRTTRNLNTLPEESERLSLSDNEVLQLAQWACLIEKHYCAKYDRSLAMDIEWAKDGSDGQLYVVQARPETVHSVRNTNVLQTYRLEGTGRVLLQGRSIGQKIGAGRVKLVHSAAELGIFEDGDVLVTDMTDPDWEPVMKRASAIVTNRGGRTCHAAIVSREIGVPCVVGTGRATEILKNAAEVTVCCASGDQGIVYEGRLPFTRSEVHLETIPKTKTRILLNLGNPEQAFSLSSLPVDGVGLAREEFIIANEVKVHPLALTRFDSVEDLTVKETVERLTAGFSSREDYFVQKLAEGIGTIAAAFYPREVIVRLSDFKTNEYANLIGGAQFEPKEENPMIGFRGASRYYNDRYKDGFALECRAMQKVRVEMGLINVKLMVPFCRTVGEARLVLDEMSKHGLKRGENGLEIYVMCELPSNVATADLFAQVFDGFSIGSNDLTQLVLGLDRDSEIVAHLFDERDEAVKRTIAKAITEVKKAGSKIGICGQAPSDYPEFAKFLVEQGVDSMSLNEDAVVRTLVLLAELEKPLGSKGSQGKLLTIS